MSSDAETASMTRKITHTKTGHTFLLYVALLEANCTFDLTIAGPSEESKDFDSKLLRRWWTETWTLDALAQLGSTPDSIETAVEEGFVSVRGWTESKARQSALTPLKIIIACDPEFQAESQQTAQSQTDRDSPPQDAQTPGRTTLQLRECSKEEAMLRQKMLLLNVTERAETRQGCHIFPRRSIRNQLADLNDEIASLNRQLKKRDKMVDDLKVQYETANEQLKEYIRDAPPPKRIHPHRKVPPNHSKAAVTKKRRLVQKVEYED